MRRLILLRVFLYLFLYLGLVSAEPVSVSITLKNSEEGTTYTIEESLNSCIKDLNIVTNTPYTIKYLPKKISIHFERTIEDTAKINYNKQKCKITHIYYDKIKCIRDFENLKVKCLFIVPKDTKTLVLHDFPLSSIFKKTITIGTYRQKLESNNLILPDNKIPNQDVLSVLELQLNKDDLKETRVYFNNKLKMIILHINLGNLDLKSFSKSVESLFKVKSYIVDNALVIDLQKEDLKDYYSGEITKTMFLHIFEVFGVLVTLITILFYFFRRE